MNNTSAPENDQASDKNECIACGRPAGKQYALCEQCRKVALETGFPDEANMPRVSPPGIQALEYDRTYAASHLSYGDNYILRTMQNRCQLCSRLLPKGCAYAAWHPMDDGCDICEYYHRKGAKLCPDCVQAAVFAGMMPDQYWGNAQEIVEHWARLTLWNAVWRPERVTVQMAETAMEYLRRTDGDLDSAMNLQPWSLDDVWTDTRAFMDDLGWALMRRLGLCEEDKSRFVKAALRTEPFDGSGCRLVGVSNETLYRMSKGLPTRVGELLDKAKREHPDAEGVHPWEPGDKSIVILDKDMKTLLVENKKREEGFSYGDRKPTLRPFERPISRR